MSGITVIGSRNVTAEFVKPRDVVAVRSAQVASVLNIEEFYTTILFYPVRGLAVAPLRIAKVAVVTVYRTDGA